MASTTIESPRPASNTSRVLPQLTSAPDAAFRIALLVPPSDDATAAEKKDYGNSVAAIAGVAIRNNYYTEAFCAIEMVMCSDDLLSAELRAIKAAARAAPTWQSTETYADALRWLTVVPTSGPPDVLGFACFHFMDAPRLTVLHLFVVPEYRRRGLATRLLRVLEAIAKDTDATSLDVDSEFNIDTLCFYAKRGFSVKPVGDISHTEYELTQRLATLARIQLADNRCVQAPNAVAMATAATEYLRTGSQHSLKQFQERYSACITTGNSMHTVWFTLKVGA